MDDIIHKKTLLVLECNEIYGGGDHPLVPTGDPSVIKPLI